MDIMRELGVVNLILNAMSIVLGLATVGLVLGLDRGNLAKRATVRFTLAIAWVDVIKAGSIIMYSLWNTGGWSCQLIGFLLVWGTLSYMFLNGMLALNLYLVFVRGKLFSGRWLKYYFCVAIGAATVFSAVLTALDTLGWDATIDVCEFKELKTVKTFVATWLLFVGWVIFVCILNGVVISLALHKLWAMRCTELPPCQTFLHLRSLVLRVVILCMVPIVTHVWGPVVRVVEFYTDIPGILNCLVFLYDPSIQNPIHNFQRLFLSGMPGSDENTEHGFVLAADSGCQCLASSNPRSHSKCTPPVAELREIPMSQLHTIQSEGIPIPTHYSRHSSDDSPTTCWARTKISSEGIMGGL